MYVDTFRTSGQGWTIQRKNQLLLTEQIPAFDGLFHFNDSGVRARGPCKHVYRP